MAFGSAGWRTFLCVPPHPLCLRVEELGFFLNAAAVARIKEARCCRSVSGSR